MCLSGGDAKLELFYSLNTTAIFNLAETETRVNLLNGSHMKLWDKAVNVVKL